jgi:hypothetical protein|tara:strand:- start:2578 stop:2853 length:276 start_codon:yes stop_codon:yes gene_type:complete
MINRNPLEWTTALYVAIFLTLFIMLGNEAMGQTKPKSKFYDFGAQIIDGEIKKPTALYTDSKKKVQFDRLLKLKKSFISDLMNTSKERTFK